MSDGVGLVALDPGLVRDLASTLDGQALAAEGSAARIQAALALCELSSAVPDRLAVRSDDWRAAAGELRERADLAEGFAPDLEVLSAGLTSVEVATPAASEVVVEVTAELEAAWRIADLSERIDGWERATAWPGWTR